LVTVYNHRKHVGEIARVEAGTPCTDLRCVDTKGPLLRGHAQVALYTERPGWAAEEMCHIWFHTGFEEIGVVKFSKDEVDMAHKDKKCQRFPPGFEVHLFLGPPNTQL